MLTRLRMAHKTMVLVGALTSATAVVAVASKIGLSHLADNIGLVEQAEKAAIASNILAERTLLLEIADSRSPN